MTSIDMSGLRADTAHGFLAGLGVVQALRRSGLHARMSWSDGFIPHAILHGVDSVEQLYGAVLDDRDQRMSGVVLGFPEVQPFPTLSRSQAELDSWLDAVTRADVRGDPDVDLWCGLLIEGGYAGSGKSKPTHFDFTAGQQQFLKICRVLGSTLDNGRLEEAILGPWLRKGTESTLRFEASGERQGARRAIPPSQDKVLGVPGADWLAFLGLAYYPLTLRAGRDDRARVVTPACDVDWNRSAFRWPVWREPLDHATIAAVVTHPGLVAENEDMRTTTPNELSAMGILSVWQCPMTRSSQGYGSFGPSSRIARSSA